MFATTKPKVNDFLQNQRSNLTNPIYESDFAQVNHEFHGQISQLHSHI